VRCATSSKPTSVRWTVSATTIPKQGGPAPHRLAAQEITSEPLPVGPPLKSTTPVTTASDSRPAVARADEALARLQLDSSPRPRPTKLSVHATAAASSHALCIPAPVESSTNRTQASDFELRADMVIHLRVERRSTTILLRHPTWRKRSALRLDRVIREGRIRTEGRGVLSHRYRRVTSPRSTRGSSLPMSPVTAQRLRHQPYDDPSSSALRRSLLRRSGRWCVLEHRQ